MNALASLLLAAAITIPTQVLILRNGTTMAVDGPVSSDNGRVLFRSGGALYSLPAAEVDLDATRAVSAAVTVVAAADRGKLKVTDAERERLLRDLEQNHSGRQPVSFESAHAVPDPATPAEKGSAEEWSWRRQARAHEEAIRQAKEQLELVRSRAEQLRDEIRALVSRGYKPSQFTYQATQLESALTQIPYAELEVTRAERAYDQFRDDARRLGVMPGWLR